MEKDAKTIREELARPFAPEDLEWREVLQFWVG